MPVSDGNNPVNHCETGHWLRLTWGGGVGRLKQNAWNSHLKACESEGSIAIQCDCQAAFRAHLKSVVKNLWELNELIHNIWKALRKEFGT